MFSLNFYWRMYHSFLWIQNDYIHTKLWLYLDMACENCIKLLVFWIGFYQKVFFSEITNIRMFLLSLILPGSDRRWYKVMHCLTHTFAVFLYWLISSLLPVVVLIFYLSFMKWLFFLSSYLDVCTNKNNFPFCYTSISFYYSLSAYFSVRTYKYGTFVIYTECNCKIVQIV